MLHKITSVFSLSLSSSIQFPLDSRILASSWTGFVDSAGMELFGAPAVIA